ncbi:biotin synthase BioB, partial [Streptomyces scabiei]|nr:biotin synthase BioB [Streptomyces scabiei]
GGGCGAHESAGAGCGSHAEGGPCGSVAATALAGEARTDLVAVRRRGAGTDLAPNA